MQKPALVVMAAGMGSRYGGLKQIDPIGRHGEIIMDYSLFDAMEAGFQKVVFIINRKIEQDFYDVIGRRAEKHIEVRYVFQQPEAMLPAGFAVPEERVKPWGTAHAILCCKDVVHEPFAAINADDYYGKRAFSVLYDYLKDAHDGEKHDYSMVGYEAQNTLTENGHVARGVCEVSTTCQRLSSRTKVSWSRSSASPLDPHSISASRNKGKGLKGCCAGICNGMPSDWPSQLTWR